MSIDSTQVFGTERQAQDREGLRKNFREMWTGLGNMSDTEVEELLDLELADNIPETVAGQVRMYELKLKTNNPENAKQMREEIGAIGGFDEADPARLVEIKKILQKYIEAELYFQGKKITDSPTDTWAEIDN